MHPETGYELFRFRRVGILGGGSSGTAEGGSWPRSSQRYCVTSQQSQALRFMPFRSAALSMYSSSSIGAENDSDRYRRTWPA
jgi:hypothetical protein